MQVITGKNDLRTVFPQLLIEWDYAKNGALIPENVAAHSNKKVWWKCEKGHSWQAFISNRSKGYGCPYCKNQRILVGFNDLGTTRPDLVIEWDFDKNKEILPQDFTANNGTKVWWRCKKGHSWQAAIRDRNNGNGCPYCSNKRVLIGYNDLLTMNPELANEWDYVKNGALAPEMVTPGSDKKVWWICKNDHSWQATISKRSKGEKCPYCSNKRVLARHNDLQTENPILAKEWDYVKNGALTPEMVTPGSDKKAWWVCPICGHEWQATVSSRNNGNGCPACFRRNQTSFPEQVIFYYIKKEYHDAVNGYKLYDKFGGRKELDIYIPLLRTGIEYDGSKWHGTKENEKKDIAKYEFCKEAGIRLIRVREKSEYYGDDSADNIIYVNAKPTYQEIEEMLHQLSLYVKIYDDINILRDETDIRQGYYSVLSNSSIAEKFPEIAMEWDYEKNGAITPKMVMAGSTDYCWWICPNGHSYKAKATNRTHGFGCPYCKNKKVLPGYNDISTLRPDILVFWNYERNTINPSELTIGSSKKVWWKCEKGHEWEAPVYLIKNGCRCPMCANKRIQIGYNDAKTLVPQFAIEWNTEKNEGKRLEDYSVNSNKKVWWKCEKGHEWQASLNNRSKGTNCPICSNRIILAGYNDLATVSPDLLREWDFENNKDIDPTKVGNGSTKDVWWICSKGHRWKTKIVNRKGNKGCPFCANQKVLEGYNDLATTHSYLIEEWDYQRNDIKPTEVLARSERKVWWRCKKCGYHWQASLYHRKNGRGCPKCAGKMHN